MELSTETKKSVIEQTVSQLEQTKYQSEVMGRAWGAIGNKEAQKTCAEKVAECIKVMDLLNKEAEELA